MKIENAFEVSLRPGAARRRRLDTDRVAFRVAPPAGGPPMTVHTHLALAGMVARSGRCLAIFCRS